MPKLSEYLLILLAAISVGLLGYYAYSIATDTFSLAFVGQNQQSSNTMRVAVAKPWIQFGSTETSPMIDESAVIQSLTKNGKPWNPTVS